MSMKMAEVIVAHRFDLERRICRCGILCGSVCDDLTYPDHLADELAKAGAGCLPCTISEVRVAERLIPSGDKVGVIPAGDGFGFL